MNKPMTEQDIIVALATLFGTEKKYIITKCFLWYRIEL